MTPDLPGNGENQGINTFVLKKDNPHKGQAPRQEPASFKRDPNCGFFQPGLENLAGRRFAYHRRPPKITRKSSGGKKNKALYRWVFAFYTGKLKFVVIVHNPKHRDSVIILSNQYNIALHCPYYSFPVKGFKYPNIITRILIFAFVRAIPAI